jgi:hypothetical protein
MTLPQPEATAELPRSRVFSCPAEKSCAGRRVHRQKRSRGVARAYAQKVKCRGADATTAAAVRAVPLLPLRAVLRGCVWISRHRTVRTGRGTSGDRYTRSSGHGGHRGSAAATRRGISGRSLMAAATARTHERRADQRRDHQLSHEHDLIPPPEQRGGRKAPPTPITCSCPPRGPHGLSRETAPGNISGKAAPANVDTPSTWLRTTSVPAPGRNGFRRSSLTR